MTWISPKQLFVEKITIYFNDNTWRNCTILSKVGWLVCLFLKEIFFCSRITCIEKVKHLAFSIHMCMSNLLDYLVQCAVTAQLFYFEISVWCWDERTVHELPVLRESGGGSCHIYERKNRKSSIWNEVIFILSRPPTSVFLAVINSSCWISGVSFILFREGLFFPKDFFSNYFVLFSEEK